MRRLVGVLAAISVVVALDWFMFLIGRAVPSLALVVLRQVPGAQSAHGEPHLSAQGIAFVVGVLALQTSLVLVCLGGTPRVCERKRWLSLGMLVLGASCCFFGLVDGRFLPTILPSAAWAALEAVLARHAPVTLELYEGWAYPRFFPLITLVHAAVCVGVTVALLMRPERRGAMA